MAPSRIGPYVVLRLLGSGGMGSVYLGEHHTLGRRDAVKVPHEAVRADSDAMHRFQREAQVAAGLSHPHITAVYDAALDHDPPYLAMQYVEGQSLKNLLREVPLLSLEHTVGLLAPVAAALDHCHERGSTHRDVKPANILLGTRGGQEWPYLTDFGIVRPDAASPLTRTGMVQGTALYLSPEQADGQPAGRASDLYALACVAFQCLTGVPPFRAATDVETLLAHRDDRPPAASAINSRLSAGVDHVLLAALDKDPAARRRAFPDVASFVAGLAAAAEPAPFEVPTPRLGMAAPTVHVAHPVQRRHTGALAGAVAVLVLGAPLAFVAADALVSRPGNGDQSTVLAVTVGVDDVLAPGAVLTPEHRALLEQGPLSSVIECVPQPEVQSRRTTAAVGCDSLLPGVDSLLLRQAEPGPALTDTMDSPNRRVGDCSREVGVDDRWTSGPLACYDNNRGVAALWWGYEDSGMSIVAVRNDGDNAALYAWFVDAEWSLPTGPPAG